VAKVPKKESNWRIAAAILAGYLSIGVLVVVTDWILGFFVPQIAREMPGFYFPMVIVTDSIYTLVGGYLCAKIALTAHRPATIGLMIFGELMGLVSVVASWYAVPHYYSIALLVLYPPMAWAGSWWRVRRVPVKPMMVRASSA
jgi:hypothetical protein